MTSYTLRPEIPKEAAENLASFSDLMRRLLFYRGIVSAAAAAEFLNPKYEPHDPFLMKDMDKAVGRLIRAISSGERVAVWSDYDADGIPGAVILHDFFRRIGFDNFEVHIPHREEDGFGLNRGGVEELASRGTKLIVTVDCGIADAAEAALARELGMDVIITDHHLPNGESPPACAILNPKQADCRYPEKMLCGAAVAFKLVQGVLRENRFGLKDGVEKWFLDMVGLATLSDQVPLVGENRIFAVFGLKVLRKSPRVGFQKLLSKLRINQRFLSEDDVGFMIAPRINAASRMGVPDDAFRLLSTDSEAEAGVLADHLHHINEERKGAVASMIKEIKKIIADRYGTGREKKVIVAGSPKWRPSLLGLVAGYIAEEHSCPVFLWGRGGEINLKGSCRSGGRVDVVALMERARGVFLDFGGHQMAGGFSVSYEKVHLLEGELSRAYGAGGGENFAGDDPGGALADYSLAIDDISFDLWRDIEKLAPFGVGNPKPIFILNEVLVDSVGRFGRENNHLRLSFRRSDGGTVTAVAFFALPKDFGGVQAGQKINLAATLERSFFRGEPELRLRIVELF